MQRCRFDGMNAEHTSWKVVLSCDYLFTQNRYAMNNRKTTTQTVLSMAFAAARASASFAIRSFSSFAIRLFSFFPIDAFQLLSPWLERSGMFASSEQLLQVLQGDSVGGLRKIELSSPGLQCARVR